MRTFHWNILYNKLKYEEFEKGFAVTLHASGTIKILIMCKKEGKTRYGCKV